MKHKLNDIIKGCAKGKAKAQSALFKEYSKKMFGVCLMYTKDRSVAEDVLQEGFVKIFKNISKFKNEGSFEGWMRRIMINIAIDKYRKNNYLYPVKDIEPYIEHINYHDDDSNQIEVDVLMKFIHELSPKYRVVFCLYAIDGYSHQDIGQQLGISEGTSKSNLSRARKLLKEKIQKYYKFEKEQRRQYFIET